MKIFDCENCGASYDQQQPRNRCAVCGYYLRQVTICDQCGKPTFEFFKTTAGRELCDSHLPLQLSVSIELVKAGELA